jgi:hypothetical protein
MPTASPTPHGPDHPPAAAGTPVPHGGAWALRAIGLGVLLIAILAPLAQFLTIATVNATAETSTPVAWAVGLVFSLVLAAFAVRTVARRELVSRPTLAVLYAMLALAVPLMNLGLIRHAFLAAYAVLREYAIEGTNTYRTAYQTLTPEWFPVVPTVEGLAWNKADRLLRLLQDTGAQRDRAAARRAIALALELPGSADVEVLAAQVVLLGVDDCSDLLATVAPEALAATGMDQVLLARQQQTASASAAAAAQLSEALREADEWVASLLPSNLRQADASSRRRLALLRAQLAPAEAAALDTRIAALAAREDELRAAVGALGQADLARLRDTLAVAWRAEWASWPAAEVDQLRHAFVYRLSREERRALARQDGTTAPNQNIHAFRSSLWPDPAARQIKERSSLRENLAFLQERLPWHLWLRPMVSWGLLFAVLFVFLMCLAEWLRRKWVDRENLTFPQVELADHLIRHDFRLELASDIRAPAPRQRPFYPWFWAGLAVGAGIIAVEAAGHYGLLPQRLLLMFDFNDLVFEPMGGAVKEIPATVFVLSPIVVGLAYLLSLEIGLSIWLTHFLYTLVVWWVKLGLPEIRDSNYTGFEGGRLYPFPMEQLAGAALVYTLFLWWKARDRGPAPTAVAPAGATNPAASGVSVFGAAANGPFVPARWARLGLIALPLAAGALLWSIGVRSFWLQAAFFGLILAQTIAAARVRAETGLPATPAFYEMTKLPMVLGMTGFTGAKTFASFVNVVFLPATLLFRTLPQHLENLELARRFRIPYRTMALAALAAFSTALVVGGFSFLIFSHYLGDTFYAHTALPPQSQPPTSTGLSTYPLWVSHFLGEPGLDQFTRLNGLRLGFIALGAGVLGLLLVLRQRFLGFPLHPIGYLVLLFAMYFHWATPYVRLEGMRWETSVLWGSVLVAWGIKKLVVKYGGMNAYKRAKPLFIGLAAGGILCVFATNALHLVCTLLAAQQTDPGPFLKAFVDHVPFSPALY